MLHARRRSTERPIEYSRSVASHAGSQAARVGVVPDQSRIGVHPYTAGMTVATPDRDQLLRRGLQLEYATLGWNVLEIVFVGSAAIAARSVALSGFAIDSFIEVFASIVVIWQLKGIASADRERRAVTMIGFALVLLALFIIGQSIVTVVLGLHPRESPFGIAWLAATVFAMLGLAYAKSRTGAALENPVLQEEAKVTMIDGILASGILVGLVLNLAFGWWWADLAAGGILVVYGFSEAREVFVQHSLA